MNPDFIPIDQLITTRLNELQEKEVRDEIQKLESHIDDAFKTFCREHEKDVKRLDEIRKQIPVCDSKSAIGVLTLEYNEIERRVYQSKYNVKTLKITPTPKEWGQESMELWMNHWKDTKNFLGVRVSSYYMFESFDCDEMHVDVATTVIMGIKWQEKHQIPFY